MNRPSRPVRVLAPVLATGILLAVAACGNQGGSSGTTSASPTPTSPATATPALTGTGARAALITKDDLGNNWTQANNAATWRDRLLVGNVDVAAFLNARTTDARCQKLLDSLYSDTLLGRAPGASALTGFTQGDARLLYQVGDYGQASLEKSLDWVKSLPDKCAQFTATGSDGGKRTVQVAKNSLPSAGDDRQGLTVTMRGTADGKPVTVTVDVAAVRVGASGITVTNGGPSGAGHDTTATAVRQGAQRLKDVLAGKTPPGTPSP
ncbi:hypothetical protein ABZ915_46200 [Streptomyces sp. NPDC046915]|uniref:hypothetical protein n=1 Tax=Streptomyces sp. NPDC046915 TaxID=3155257 RepID=UPI0033DCEA09